jgi:replicative superfamily II helicase
MDELGQTAEVDWVAVRIAYEARDETEAQILRRFGITPSKLRHHREKEQWIKRSARTVERGTLVMAMMRVLARQITILERQMTGTIDKEATLLGTMAKTLEKLMELEKADAAQRPAQKDLTELRNKVAKRIEQLTRRNDVG